MFGLFKAATFEDDRLSMALWFRRFRRVSLNTTRRTGMPLPPRNLLSGLSRSRGLIEPEMSGLRFSRSGFALSRSAAHQKVVLPLRLPSVSPGMRSTPSARAFKTGSDGELCGSVV
jgi:hypothetical protein